MMKESVNFEAKRDSKCGIPWTCDNEDNYNKGYLSYFALTPRIIRTKGIFTNPAFTARIITINNIFPIRR